MPIHDIDEYYEMYSSVFHFLGLDMKKSGPSDPFFFTDLLPDILEELKEYAVARPELEIQARTLEDISGALDRHHQRLQEQYSRRRSDSE